MNLENLKTELENRSLVEALSYLADTFGGEVVFSTSFGQEDQVITDAIFRNDLNINVFTLDTGRLFQETYTLADGTKARYKKEIKTYFPDADNVQKLVAERGHNGFYFSVENRKECCRVRKIEPLTKALAGAKIWITGLRAEQSDNRAGMELVEWDERFQVVKVNPLMAWSYDEVIKYIEENRIPDNPLHRKGFVSIGCLPCTRAIEPNEHPRAGRWWWEESQKECGLHS
jgi:phosphoadenosine phosphosulfate reductase